MKFLSILLSSFILLTCVNVTDLQGQPRFPPAGDGVGHQGPGTYCSYDLYIQVPLTNLNLFPPTLNGKGKETLPQSYPPMFLELQYDGQTYNYPVTEFDFFVQDNSAFNLYISTIKHRINYCHDCYDSGPGFSIFTYPITMKLLLENGDPYPACDYTDADDIFSCLYFDTPCPSTSNSSTKIADTCNNPELTEGNGTFKISCYNVSAVQDSIRKGSSFNSGIGRRSRLDASSTDQKLNVYPNPSIDEVNIYIPTVIENGQLDIFNTSGQKVYNSAKLKGDTTHSVNTSELSAGTYIIRVQEQDLVLYKRIMKL